MKDLLMAKDDEKKDLAKTSKAPSVGYQKFVKATSGHSKDVSAILNIHLVAEYYLDQIILISLPRADVLLNETRLTFALKLLIVKSLDVVSDDVVASLKGLNRVRNLCSHELEYRVTESNIDLIGRPYGKKYTSYKKQYPLDYLQYTLMAPIAKLEATYDRLHDKSTPD